MAPSSSSHLLTSNKTNVWLKGQTLDHLLQKNFATTKTEVYFVVINQINRDSTNFTACDLIARLLDKKTILNPSNKSTYCLFRTPIVMMISPTT